MMIDDNPFPRHVMCMNCRHEPVSVLCTNGRCEQCHTAHCMLMRHTYPSKCVPNEDDVNNPSPEIDKALRVVNAYKSLAGSIFYTFSFCDVMARHPEALEAAEKLAALLKNARVGGRP